MSEVKLVHTQLGELPESDLQFLLSEKDVGDTITVSREWKYIGNDPAHQQHLGEVVRRDVWVTMKIGVSLAGSTEL